MKYKCKSVELEDKCLQWVQLILLELSALCCPPSYWQKSSEN